MYEATIEDPTVYTRPWKISFPIYRRLEAERSAAGVQLRAVRRRDDTPPGPVQSTESIVTVTEEL